MIDSVTHPEPSITLSRDVGRFEWGVLQLNGTARRLFVAGRPLALRLKEFDLLRVMLEQPDRCFSRDELLERVWDVDFDTGTNLVDAVVYSLRKKMRQVTDQPVIETVRGVGYRLA